MFPVLYAALFAELAESYLAQDRAAKEAEYRAMQAAPLYAPPPRRCGYCHSLHVATNCPNCGAP
jgi:hypothetical protein